MNCETNKATGEKRWVHVSRTGRIYGGATAEEVERKTLLASLHALKRTVGSDLAVEMCAKMFGGICHFGDLTNSQMRELKNTFIESLRYGKQLEEAQRIEPLITDAQRKKIIRLGLYVLGPKYGKQWFWRKCKEWVVRLRDADRVDLNKLTNQEAWTVIKRLERIEAQLKKGGGQ